MAVPVEFERQTEICGDKAKVATLEEGELSIFSGVRQVHRPAVHLTAEHGHVYRITVHR